MWLYTYYTDKRYPITAKSSNHRRDDVVIVYVRNYFAWWSRSGCFTHYTPVRIPVRIVNWVCTSNIGLGTK